MIDDCYMHLFLAGKTQVSMEYADGMNVLEEMGWFLFYVGSDYNHSTTAWVSTIINRDEKLSQGESESKVNFVGRQKSQ